MTSVSGKRQQVLFDKNLTSITSTAVRLDMLDQIQDSGGLVSQDASGHYQIITGCDHVSFDFCVATIDAVTMDGSGHVVMMDRHLFSGSWRGDNGFTLGSRISKTSIWREGQAYLALEQAFQLPIIIQSKDEDGPQRPVSYLYPPGFDTEAMRAVHAFPAEYVGPWNGRRLAFSQINSLLHCTK